MEKTTPLPFVILKHMHDYQKINNIKQHCAVNTWIYLTLLNKIFPKEKCISNVGILHLSDGFDKSGSVTHIPHCWCVFNGLNIDPSYEFQDIPNSKKTYYNTINDFLKDMDSLDIDVSQEIKENNTVEERDRLEKYLNYFIENIDLNFKKIHPKSIKHLNEIIEYLKGIDFLLPDSIYKNEL